MLNVCLESEGRDSKDGVYYCDNSLNSGKCAYNNMQAHPLTFAGDINSFFLEAVSNSDKLGEVRSFEGVLGIGPCKSCKPRTRSSTAEVPILISAAVYRT